MTEDRRMTPYTNEDYMLSLMATVSEIKTTVAHLSDRSKEFQATVEAKLEKLENKSTDSDTQIIDEFERLLSNAMEGVNARLAKQDARVDMVTGKVLALENKPKDTVYTYFIKATDKVVMLCIGGVIAAVIGLLK